MGYPRLIHVATVSATLNFFRGHISYLNDRGYEISLISSDGDEGRAISLDTGIPFYPVRIRRDIDLVDDFVALTRLWRLFKKIEPDIVHAHTPKAGLLGVISARLAGVPVVFLSVFGLRQMTMRGSKRLLLNALTKISCSLAHRVWCDSFSIKEYLINKRLCRGQKVFVVANGSVSGVDANNMFSPDRILPGIRNEVRDDLKIPGDSVVLGFSGRVAYDKGIHELADAWRILRTARNDLHLMVIGNIDETDPPGPQDISLLNGDPRVHMVGFQKDVSRFLAAVDIFVMPSYREGFGLSNIEASAMGIPVVSTRIPGCVDSVKDGVTGILVPARDSQSLVAAIYSYLNDADLRRRHGLAGRERAIEEFRPESIWRGLHERYCEQIKDLNK